jgi:hypothetical protein
VPAAAEQLQVAQRRVAHKDDVGAAPAVASIRPAARHVRLAPERHGAVATRAGLDEDACTILKHRIGP